MTHLFLIGFMGAGKSTVARLVADELGWPCVDLDEVIERQCGQSCASVFAEQGEERFRDMESSALAALEHAPRSVVACGGGIVLRPENRALLKRLGTTVYLKVSPGEALARIGDVSSRPLLAGAAGALAATSLLSARESLYKATADVTIDTEGLNAREVAVRVSREIEGLTNEV